MLVMDNSALVEIGRGSSVGLALRELMLVDEKIIAPDLLSFEAVSVTRKLVLSGVLDRRRAAEFVGGTLSLVDEFVPAAELQVEALNESVRLGHSSYDMFYFVLARRTGATLFTLDKSLAQLCINNGVNVVEDVALPEWMV